jgi:radical SAM superfamily enzyme YgiQ (UPF0313 family)
MLSNYCWNEALSFHLAKLAKRIQPQTLTVMGGPNIMLEPERQCEYLVRHPEVDVYVLGEGDFLATEVVRHYLDCGRDWRAMGNRDLPSCLYRRTDGTVVRSELRPRCKEIDDIPSPWLTGILDEFFDGKLAPIIETNRGCPFTCTFCCQGTNWYTKVHYFSQERLRQELLYIAKKIRQQSPLMRTLRIADSNYGMYKRDVEISSYLGAIQKEYGWPGYVDATTGRNRPDRIIKSIEKVNGAMTLDQAVQSLDAEVLRNIKRSNARMQAYDQLRVYIRGRGLRSNTDLILGLPGETLKTHLDGLRQVLDQGISRVTNFQLMLLKGTGLETAKSREMFRFQSGFRVLPKNFGVYGGEKVFDVEEIVCATETLSFEDYLKARLFALVCAFVWLDNYFDEVVGFVESLDVPRSEWLDAVVEEMENEPGEVGRWLEDFAKETKNELFPTQEACVEFYSREENFVKLLDAEIGDNLLHKYRAIASFHLWPAACRCVMEASRKLLISRSARLRIQSFDAFWEDFHRFMDDRHAQGRTAEAILSPLRSRMSYNIAAWISAGSPHDPGPFRNDSPRHFEFRLSEGSARSLRSALELWGEEVKGLTKMVARLQVGGQNRHCHPEG